MSWDLKLAKKLKKNARQAQSSTTFTGTVVKASPLVVSAVNGSLMLSGSRLQVSDAVTGLAVGDTVCLVGTGPYTIVARV